MIELQDEKWLSTSEVASTLHISRSTLFTLRKKGDAPTNIKLGRRLYFSQQELVEWLNSRERAS